MTAPSGESVSFSIVNMPAWATFNTSTGALSGTPTTASVGIFANILISVTGGETTVSLPAFSIQVVAAVNNAPTITGNPATSVIAGTQYSFTPTAADPSGNSLTFSIMNAPSWASFSASSGQLSGTPTTADAGNYPNIVISGKRRHLERIACRLLDPGAAACERHTGYRWHSRAERGGRQRLQLHADDNDPSGQPLVFSIQGLPSWATFPRAPASFPGRPLPPMSASYPGIVISVTDGNESVSLPAFTIKVKALPDGAPSIGGTPPSSVVAGSAYTFTPTASDPDGDALTFSAANLPSWASFSSNTGRLSGTPTKAYIGTYSNIVISVSNGTATTALPAFSIQVNAPPDQAPLIGGAPSTSVVAGSAYAFTPTASSPAGNPLTFSIANLPSWANFNSNSGRLSGTPATANVGTFSNIVISVSDGTLSASLPAFAISVSAPANPPPTIGGTPATSVAAGAVYSFTPTTTDPSGNTLTFSIQNLPAWAAFNAQTGVLSGTPGAGGRRDRYAASSSASLTAPRARRLRLSASA